MQRAERCEVPCVHFFLWAILSSFFFSIKDILWVCISLGGDDDDVQRLIANSFLLLCKCTSLLILILCVLMKRLLSCLPRPQTPLWWWPCNAKSMRNTSQAGSALSSPLSFCLEDELDAYSSSDGAAMAPIGRLGELWGKKKSSKYKFLAIIKMARLPDSVKAFSFQALLYSEAELHQVRAAMALSVWLKKKKRKKRATVDLTMLTWTCPRWGSHLGFLKQS